MNNFLSGVKKSLSNVPIGSKSGGPLEQRTIGDLSSKAVASARGVFQGTKSGNHENAGKYYSLTDDEFKKIRNQSEEGKFIKPDTVQTCNFYVTCKDAKNMIGQIKTYVKKIHTQHDTEKANADIKFKDEITKIATHMKGDGDEHIQTHADACTRIKTIYNAKESDMKTAKKKKEDELKKIYRFNDPIPCHLRPQTVNPDAKVHTINLVSGTVEVILEDGSNKKYTYSITNMCIGQDTNATHFMTKESTCSAQGGGSKSKKHSGGSKNKSHNSDTSNGICE